MLRRRYGERIHRVRPRFDAHALTEIAFERLGEAWPAEAWLASHERIAEHALTAEAEGDVKDDAEKGLIATLRERLDAVLASLPPGAVALVENSPHDHPKTRDTTTEIPHPLGNRLHFRWRVEPPLLIGVYRPREQP